MSTSTINNFNFSLLRRFWFILLSDRCKTTSKLRLNYGNVHKKEKKLSGKALAIKQQTTIFEYITRPFVFEFLIYYHVNGYQSSIDLFIT